MDGWSLNGDSKLPHRVIVMRGDKGSVGVPVQFRKVKMRTCCRWSNGIEQHGEGRQSG